MDYTTLISAKGTAGSILNWVGYSKMDAPTLLEESQALIYEFLRVREMRKEWVFGASVGTSAISLPSRFLDPIGKIENTVQNTEYDHLTEARVKELRTYDEISSVSLGASPFTTVSGSGLVTVNKTAHGITQDSKLTIAGASAVNSITPNGTYPVVSITDADNFVIDTGGTASASGSGGGSSATYTGSLLVQGSPICWSIWDDQVKFNAAFDEAAVMSMLYYRLPDSLSATNTTNFLTIKYPRLLRVASLAIAAEFMKDDAEYNKQVAALQAMIRQTAITDDFSYRGASFGTETP